MFNKAETPSDSGAVADSGSDTSEAAAPITVPAHARGRGIRSSLPARLQRVRIADELPADEQVRPHDGTRLKGFGEQTFEALNSVQVKIQAWHHVCATYRWRCFYEHVITVSAVPNRKYQVSSCLLDHIAAVKYVDALNANSLNLERMKAALRSTGPVCPLSVAWIWSAASPNYVLLDAELTAMPHCSRCGGDNIDGAGECRVCRRESVEHSVPSNTMRRNYTPQHLLDALPGALDATTAERKRVSVLFCDIVDSTALAQSIGAESMHQSLSHFFELSLASVHQYGGVVNQFLGDGFMALFGAPIADEDHAWHAILAAIDIRRRVAASDLILEGLKSSVQLRFGINSGDVVIGAIGDELRMDYTAIGDVTHTAARLQALAEPNTILIGAETFHEVENRIDYRSRGIRRVKGYRQGIASYEILGARAHGAIRSIPTGADLNYVGRVRERVTCTEAITRLARGHGSILSISGEAGLGKSRLVEEMRAQSSLTDLRWLEGHSVSFGRSLSLWPFLEIVRQCFNIGIDDSADVVRTKLEAGLEELFGALYVELSPYLLTLLSVPVQGSLVERVQYLDSIAMGQQVYRAILRLFERLATERAVVVVLEDWQWADQSSGLLLRHLLPLVMRVPILFVVVWRVETDATRPLVETIVQELTLENYTFRIELAPLDDRICAELSRIVLGAGDMMPALREILIPRASGNPLFLVEMLRALVANGAIIYDRVGEMWSASESFDATQIPATIQGVVHARIDRLDDDVRQVLKTAAVIGRAFFYRVLKAISDHDCDIDTALRVLQETDLVGKRRLKPDLEYAFRHPLIRDAAYETILSGRRRRLHHQVAEAIESAFEGQTEDHCALLAYHYARAENWERAHKYLMRAGEHAARIAADDEALDHYRHAQIVYAQAFGERWDGVQKATLACRMGEALFRRGNHDSAAEQFQQALRHLGYSYPRRSSSLVLRMLFDLCRHGALTAIGAVRQVVPVDHETNNALIHRIYLGMSQLDFYVEPRRFALDVLTGVNWAIRAGAPNTISQGCAGLSVIAATLGADRLCRYYQRKAARHPVTRRRVPFRAMCWHMLICIRVTGRNASPDSFEPLKPTV